MARTQIYQIQLTKQVGRVSKRATERLLSEIQDAARINAMGGEYSKGRLAQSIFKTDAFVIGRSANGSVGSRLPYAKIVEQGARVHNIFPKGAPHTYRFGRARRPMLKFTWRGRTVFMNQIPGGPGTIGRSHPGQPGKHFLVKALVGVAARHQLRVIIFEV